MKWLQLYYSSTTGMYYLMGTRKYQFCNTLNNKWVWSSNHKSALSRINLRLVGNNFRLK